DAAGEYRSDSVADALPRLLSTPPQFRARRGIEPLQRSCAGDDQLRLPLDGGEQGSAVRPVGIRSFALPLHLAALAVAGQQVRYLLFLRLFEQQQAEPVIPEWIVADGETEIRRRDGPAQDPFAVEIPRCQARRAEQDVDALAIADGGRSGVPAPQIFEQPRA